MPLNDSAIDNFVISNRDNNGGALTGTLVSVLWTGSFVIRQHMTHSAFTNEVKQHHLRDLAHVGQSTGQLSDILFFFRFCAGQRFIAALSHTGGQARLS